MSKMKALSQFIEETLRKLVDEFMSNVNVVDEEPEENPALVYAHFDWERCLADIMGDINEYVNDKSKATFKYYTSQVIWELWRRERERNV
jgi:hypothetical protein